MVVNPSTKLRIKTAILPVAGLGTRVMPLTLHQAKGMIGIVDRPMVHYVIDEIASAGVKHIVIVHGPNQKEFEAYVDYLEQDPSWKKLNVKFDFVVQENPRGNGDAIYIAKNFVKNDPFLVCFGDDLLADKKPPLKTFLNLFAKVAAPMVMLEPVPKKLVSRYGVVRARKDANQKDLYKISDVVEKPKPEDAPSNLTIIGRYVLDKKTLDYVGKLYSNQKLGKDAILLAEALKNYANDGHPLYGWHFRGRRFDGGSKIGILKAQAYFGIHHKELGPEFRKFLSSI